MKEVKLKKKFSNEELDFYVIQGSINNDNSKGYLEIILKSDKIAIGEVIELLDENDNYYKCRVVSMDFGSSEVKIENNSINVIEYGEPKLRELLNVAYKGEQVTLRLKVQDYNIENTNKATYLDASTGTKELLISSNFVQRSNLPVVNELRGNFSISFLGHVFTLKLMEKRIMLDIELDRKKSEAIQQSIIMSNDGLISKMYKSNLENKHKKLLKCIEDKKTWFELWKNTMYTDVIQEYRFLDIDEIKRRYHDEEGNVKLYLILQEALLNPLYFEIKDFKGGKVYETDSKLVAKKIGNYVGVDEKLVVDMLDNTDSFIKGATGYWKRMIKYSLIGGGIVAITAGLATPFIATGIGGFMGLSGAAAYTAGLSFLGGGAIAAGGLGMAGGSIVVLAAGALIGGASGGKIAYETSKMTNEMLLFTMVKIVNYVRYLNNKSDLASKDLANKIKMDFLEFKHSYEREVMMKKVSFDKDKNSTINFTYMKLTEI